MVEKYGLRIILKIKEQHLHSVYHQQKQELRYNILRYNVVDHR